MTTATDVRTAHVRPVGGLTVIVEIGGLRLITDPTLDLPAKTDNGRPRRTTAPAFAPRQLGRLDAALVSHDQHPDNLDSAGRDLLKEIPVVLTTREGAKRLGGSAQGLAPWQKVDLDRPRGGQLRVTALPAQHGPQGAEAVSGPVIGFLLSGDGLPSVYISGDNASLEVVRRVVAHLGQIEIAVLFAGAASVPSLFDGAPLTLGSAAAVEAARVLGARAVVPIHCDGWTHYTQDSASLAAAFAGAGMESVLHVVADGATVKL